MAEDGSIKHQRDQIMKRVAVKHCIVPNYDAFESVDQEIIKNRSRLAMAQMQYVELVRTLHAFIVFIDFFTDAILFVFELVQVYAPVHQYVILQFYHTINRYSPSSNL